MEKYYCSNCMLLNDENEACLHCGSKELKQISISVHNQNSKYIVEE